MITCIRYVARGVAFRFRQRRELIGCGDRFGQSVVLGNMVSRVHHIRL
jgi:hypothetical protein